MASEFFGSDADEMSLNQYADLLDGLAESRQQLNAVAAPLIQTMAGGITINDSALNKIGGVLKSQLTKAVNGNAATLDTVTQPLQTALIAGVGEVSAQTNVLAQQAAGSQLSQPPPLSGGVTNATGGTDDGEFTPTSGLMYPISGLLQSPTQSVDDALSLNPDILQKAAASIGIANNAFIAEIPPAMPAGKWILPIVDPNFQPLGKIVFADKMPQKGVVKSDKLPKQVETVGYFNALWYVLPTVPVVMPVTPPLSPPPSGSVPPLGPPTVPTPVGVPPFPQPPRQPVPQPVPPFPQPQPPGGAVPPGPQPQPQQPQQPQPVPPLPGQPPQQPQPVPPIPGQPQPIGGVHPLQPPQPQQPVPGQPQPQPLPPIGQPPQPQPQPVPPVGTAPIGTTGGGIPPISGVPVFPPPIYTPSPPVLSPPPPTGSYPPGTTVVQSPGGVTSITVNACCQGPQPADPSCDNDSGDSGCRVRVKGAGDERPDDVPDPVIVCGNQVMPLTIPLPGTPLWCRTQDVIIAGLVDIGTTMIGWIHDQVKLWLGNVTKTCNEEDDWGTSPLSWIKHLAWMLKHWVQCLEKPMLEWLHNYLCGLESGFLQVGTCRTPALIALAAVLTSVRLLKKMQIGWDAAVWATIDASLDLPSVERAIEYLINIVCPSKIPGEGDAIEASLVGWLPDDLYKCWLESHGFSSASMEYVRFSRRERLSVEQVIEISRRRNIDDKVTTDFLRKYGMIDDLERASAMELYDELPTISDHLHWLQRNVFDDDYVRDYNLMDGFIDRFWAKFGHDLRAQGMKQEYAALHYAAHWIQPSVGQLFELLRRNRPGRVDKAIEFTEQDLLRLMAEQDIAPWFRQRLRNIAYVPFGLRFLRQLYDTLQIDDAEASQRFQDLGYKPPDADMLVRSEQIRRARTVATQTRGYTVPNIRSLYLAGKMQTAEAIKRLSDLGYPDKSGKDALEAWGRVNQLKAVDDGTKTARKLVIDSAKQGVQLGVVTQQQGTDALVRAGFTVDNASSIVTSWITLDRIRITRVGISQIKKGVMSGQISLTDSVNLLSHLGLTQEKVNEYVNVWTYDLAAGKRHLAASEIQRLLTEGLMDVATARTRLANLNYADPDAILLLSEAQYRITKNEQKVIAAEAKTKDQQAKALLKAIAANKQQLARMQKQLTGLGTVKALTTWYRSGLIGPAYLRSRLEGMGYQDSDITLLIEEANIEGATKRGTQAVTPSNPGVGATGPTPGSPNGQ